MIVYLVKIPLLPELILAKGSREELLEKVTQELGLSFFFFSLLQ